MSKSYDLGFLGGGQLARMSIQAAQRMGLQCLSLDPGKVTPASQIAPSIEGNLDDSESIAKVFSQCAHVTLENEFIPAHAIRTAFGIAGVQESILVPRVDTLEVIQDKLMQRHAYASAGVPSPKAAAIDGNGDSAIASIGFPMVLKARFGGYDGKGTRYAKTREEFDSHRDLWSKGGWMAEEFVPFKRELAVMVFISNWGAGCFPTMETIQTNHVCDLVFPSGTDASEIALAAVESVGGYGLFGVELFELVDGTFSVNEMAPRPHNTGHYSLDWGGISQFEQHVRCAFGLPTIVAQGGPACMANLLGQSDSDDYSKGLRHSLQSVPDARVHWYGKAESRLGRKMGHINCVGDDVIERAKRAREAFYKGVAS